MLPLITNNFIDRQVLLYSFSMLGDYEKQKAVNHNIIFGLASKF